MLPFQPQSAYARPEPITAFHQNAIPLPPPIAVDRFPIFPVSPEKFIVLSICTFGIYELYWSYKNWQRIASFTGERMSPFWRAFFAPIWSYALFKELKDACTHRGSPVSYSPGWLALAYFVLQVTWRLPEPFNLISLFTFLPFLPVLVSAQTLNSRYQSTNGETLNKQFSGWNIAATVLGGIVVVLAIIGSLMS